MFASFLTSALLELWQNERQEQALEPSPAPPVPASPLSAAVATLLKKWMQEQQFQGKA